jgi:uncharacterized protein (DUF1330 family)
MIAMTAYAIFIREETLDPAEMELYAAKATSGAENFSLEVLAAYGGHEVVEGPEVEGVVIIAFPTMEEAKRWYNGPAYQEAVQHRFKGARYHGIFVNGLDA